MKKDEADEIRRIHQSLGIANDYARRTGLPRQTTPGDLISIGKDMFGREQRLRQPAAVGWQAMKNAAADDGVDVQVISAFRSLDYQVQLVRNKLDAGEPIAHVLSRIAAPGYSEHQSGCAVDVGCAGSEPVTEDFETTVAFTWLCQRAADFGFKLSYPRDNPHGVVYEPWHWCFRV